ncbi:MAG: hypothetical protein E6Z48_15055 [Clostridium butyricum]|nr:hypothetical protein [Clostridium butyricum]
MILNLVKLNLLEIMKYLKIRNLKSKVKNKCRTWRNEAAASSYVQL